MTRSVLEGFHTMRSFTNQKRQKDTIDFMSDCLDLDAHRRGSTPAA